MGDSGVGKTSVSLRYTDDMFCEGYYSTIGVDFKIRTLNVNNKKIKLQMWDTAGQDRFKTITYSYYRGANGFILAFDLTNKQSFENLSSKWINDIKQYSQENIIILLVGTKCDLKDKIEVTDEKAFAFAKAHGIKYIKTSSKNSDNIEKAFNTLAESILESISKKIDSNIKDSRSTNTSIILNNNESFSQKKCC